MSKELERSLEDMISHELQPFVEERKAKKSKERDSLLGIQSYSFYSPEQFGIEPGYSDRIEKESWGTCWGHCYGRVFTVFERIVYREQDRPSDREVLRQLDNGHASFYVALCRAKLEGLMRVERVEEAVYLWSEYFNEWEFWFRNHYPNYLLTISESEVLHRENSEKFMTQLKTLSKSRK